MDDEVKFVTLAKCLEGRYLQHIEDILENPPATGIYEKLKRALIRALIDRDRSGQEAGGVRWWKPSQFHQHLRKLASPSTSDDFILSLWRTRLPASIRRILAGVDDSDPERLLQQADLIAEEFGPDHQRTARIATLAGPPPHNSGTRIKGRYKSTNSKNKCIEFRSSPASANEKT